MEPNCHSTAPPSDSLGSSTQVSLPDTESKVELEPPSVPVFAPPEKFTIFTNRQKWTIVLLNSLAAIFGPISSNIYVPAIPQIVQQFHTSTQKINLTLTIYLVFQATSPSLFSGLSDAFGRRPVIILCLSIYVFACVGIACTPTNAYWLLMLLRALQATGGSPAIGTGAGTISDIATPGERGKFMGLFQGVALIGPAFGPVLGGILVQYLSWRWIFWLLSMWAGSNVFTIFFFMPETLRGLVGDGSIPPPLLNCRPIDLLRRKDQDPEQQSHSPLPEKKPYKPLATFRMLAYPETLLLLAFGSCAFSCMFASLTVFSSVLADDYGYSDVKIGLCYLAQGFGSMVVGIWGGRIHDHRFAMLKRQLAFVPKHPRDLDGFPIEKCRLTYVPYILPIYLGAVIGYGFCLQHQVNIAAPLVLSTIIGMGAQSASQLCSLLLVDMFPANAGAASASYNLIRCSVSAVVTAIVDPLINSVGLGWTFSILAAATLAAYPAVIILQIKGPGWRKKRSQAWGPTAVTVR